MVMFMLSRREMVRAGFQMKKAIINDWAEKRVVEAIRKVYNRRKNSDLRADDPEIKEALAEVLRQLARDCADLTKMTDIHYHYDWMPEKDEWDRSREDAKETLAAAARIIRENFS